jgi:hypothetical protein
MNQYKLQWNPFMLKTPLCKHFHRSPEMFTLRGSTVFKIFGKKHDGQTPDKKSQILNYEISKNCLSLKHMLRDIRSIKVSENYKFLMKFFYNLHKCYEFSQFS